MLESTTELRSTVGPTFELGSQQSARLEMGKLQWNLHAALTRAQRIDTRGFECEDADRLRAVHVPEVRASLEDAIVVLGAVLDHYERVSEAPQSEESGVFHCMFEDAVETPAETDPHQRVADVAFMARWELIRKLDGLTSVAQLEQWELISACASALRRVVKAVSGVERVLAEVERRPSLFVALYQTQRQLAVSIRGAYTRLIRQLRDIESRREVLGISRCLRLVGTAIASLVGLDIYESLRIEDRRTLRSVQRRLIDWLRSDRDTLAGERLLGDACALGSLLLEVNRRPELIEHDIERLCELHRELAQPQLDKIETYERLIELRGRDQELDELLDAYAELEQWRQPIARVLAQLGGEHLRY